MGVHATASGSDAPRAVCVPVACLFASSPPRLVPPYSTRAEDHGNSWGWAFFRARKCSLPQAYAFESMRWPGFYLSASDMGNSYLAPKHGKLGLLEQPSFDPTNAHDTACWFTISPVKQLFCVTAPLECKMGSRTHTTSAQGATTRGATHAAVAIAAYFSCCWTKR